MTVAFSLVIAAPRSSIATSTFFHPSRDCLVSTARPGSWHELQAFTNVSLPAPSGNSASADTADDAGAGRSCARSVAAVHTPTANASPTTRTVDERFILRLIRPSGPASASRRHD